MTDTTVTPTSARTAPDAAGAPDLDALRTIGTPLDGNVPEAPPAQAWADRRLHYNLVNPNNRRKFTVIVVGTGLAGSGAAAGD